MEKEKIEDGQTNEKNIKGMDINASLVISGLGDVGSVFELESTPFSSEEEDSEKKKGNNVNSVAPNTNQAIGKCNSRLISKKGREFTKSRDLIASGIINNPDKNKHDDIVREKSAISKNEDEGQLSLKLDEFSEFMNIISQIIGKELPSNNDLNGFLIEILKNGSPVVSHFAQNELKVRNYKELIVNIDRQNNELREKLRILTAEYTEMMNKPPRSPVEESKEKMEKDFVNNDDDSLVSKIKELEDKNFDINQQLLSLISVKEENEVLKNKLEILQKEFIRQKDNDKEGSRSECNADKTSEKTEDKEKYSNKGFVDNTEELMKPLAKYEISVSSSDKIEDEDNDKNSISIHESFLADLSSINDTDAVYNGEIKRYKAEAARLRGQILELKRKSKEDSEVIERMKESIKNLVKDKQESVSRIVDMKAKVNRVKEKKDAAIRSVEEAKTKTMEVKVPDPLIEKELHKTKERMDGMEDKIKRFKGIIREQKNQMSEKDEDLEEMRDKMSWMLLKVKKYKETVEEKELMIRKMNSLIDEAKTFYHFKEDYEILNRQFQDIQTQHKIELEKTRMIMEDMNSKLKAFEHVETENRKMQESIKTSEQLIDVKEKIIEKLLRDVKQLGAEKEGLQQEIKEKEEENKEKQIILAGADEATRKLQDAYFKLDDSNNTIRILKKKHKTRTNSYKEKINKLENQIKLTAKRNQKIERRFFDLVKNYNKLVDNYNGLVEKREKSFFNESDLMRQIIVSSLEKDQTCTLVNSDDKEDENSFRPGDNCPKDSNYLSDISQYESNELSSREDLTSNKSRTNGSLSLTKDSRQCKSLEDLSCEVSQWRSIVNLVKDKDSSLRDANCSSCRDLNASDSSRIIVYRDVYNEAAPEELNRLKRENSCQKELLQKYMAKTLKYKQIIISKMEELEMVANESQRYQNASFSIDDSPVENTAPNSLAITNSNSTGVVTPRNRITSEVPTTGNSAIDNIDNDDDNDDQSSSSITHSPRTYGWSQRTSRDLVELSSHPDCANQNNNLEISYTINNNVNSDLDDLMSMRRYNSLPGFGIYGKSAMRRRKSTNDVRGIGYN